MNIVPRELVSFIHRQRIPTNLMCAVLVFLVTKPMQAQDILMSTPAEPAIAPVLRQQAPPPPLSNQPSATHNPFHIGPVTLHPLLSYRFSSVDGLPARGGLRISSDIHTMSAGVTADLSDHWSASYNPSWITYSSPEMSDSFNQAASLSGAYQVEDLGINLNQSYSSGNPTLAELGLQTKQKIWATSASASYALGQKTYLSINGSLNDRQTSDAVNQRTWATQGAINYRLSPRVSLNLGPGFSYTEIADGPDMYGENYIGRISWQLADKLTLGFGGGLQYIHSKSAVGRDFSSPVLDFSVGYHPFETTTLSATITRSTAASYFRDQATEDLGWTLGLNQRLLGRLYLNATYSHRTNDYSSLKSLVAINRSDVITAFSVSLSTKVTEQISASASWQKNENSTNAAGFAFSSKQYGIELSWHF